MKSILTSLCVVLALFMLATPAMAQQPTEVDLDILADKIKADKKLFVSMNMKLTEQETKDFWPLYELYQKELELKNAKLGLLISEYADAYNKGPVANDIAAKLIKEILSYEAGELKTKIAYMAKIGKVLPAHKVARYLQIENKIRAILKFELATEIPLMH
jgi:hypothetical protein